MNSQHLRTKPIASGNSGYIKELTERIKTLEAELSARRGKKRSRYDSAFYSPFAPAPKEGQSWLLTYLDLLTLLLVLLVIMLAFSGNGYRQVAPRDSAQESIPLTHPVHTSDQASRPALVSSTQSDGSDLFLSAAIITTPVEAEPAPDIPLTTTPQTIANEPITPIAWDETPVFLAADLGLEPYPVITATPANTGSSGVHIGTGLKKPPHQDTKPLLEHYPGYLAARDNLPEIDNNPFTDLNLSDLGSDIDVIITDQTVSLRINNEILFSSGQADLSRPGLAVLQNVLTVVKDTPYQIAVQGHTDPVPIQSSRFPSNWELSAARAGSVVRYLESNGVDSSRLRAIAYADTRPLKENINEEGRAANRRVELILELPTNEPG